MIILSLNYPILDNGPSKKYAGMRDKIIVPSIISNQGWTITWRPNQVYKTWKKCMMCLGTQFLHKENAFGKLETVICFHCKGKGSLYEDTPEDTRGRK